MLSNNIATLTDKKGINNIEVEVNKGGKLKDYVEFKIRDKEGEWIKSYISIKSLYGLVFLLVGEKEQDEMMPIRKTQVRVYERQHKIKLGRDMKKGEIVVANCKIEVPIRVEENIRALMGKKYRTNSGILIPSKMR